MMKVTIDRFEENFAVVETESGEMLTAPKTLFKDANEGDTVEIRVVKNRFRKASAEASDPLEKTPEISTGETAEDIVAEEEENPDFIAQNPAAIFEKLRRKAKDRNA